MVDSSRLPQILAGSKADRLKRPIDAAGVWLRISRSNGIPEFPVRRDELTEELSPVQTLANTALQTAESKVDAAQVLTLLTTAFANLFQEYILLGGIEDRQIDPIDNREYIYTVFTITTQYQGTFEELALVSNDPTETLLDIEYGVYKEGSRLVIVFRDMAEGFPDGVAKIKLIGTPNLNANLPVTNGVVITPAIASVSSSDIITITFNGYDPAQQYFTIANLNGVPVESLSNALPADIGVNKVIQFNAANFAGQPLPAQLQVIGGDLGSNLITINP